MDCCKRGDVKGGCRPEDMPTSPSNAGVHDRPKQKLTGTTRHARKDEFFGKRSIKRMQIRRSWSMPAIFGGEWIGKTKSKQNPFPGLLAFIITGIGSPNSCFLLGYTSDADP